MKLTKQQVESTVAKIRNTDDNLCEAQAFFNAATGANPDEDGSSVEQDQRIEEIRLELDALENRKVDLENQWVNLATTAVIAHYNAAVELEFNSLWKQALSHYEKAGQLAALAMKAQNPMSIKIRQAIAKMRMKVRNKVQLPDKLTL